MKSKLTFLLLFVCYLTKAQNAATVSLDLQSKIKIKAQAYLNADPSYPKVVSENHWSDAMLQHVRSDLTGIIDKTDKVDINTKIDSLIALNKGLPGYPNVNTVYAIMHVVKKQDNYAAYSFYLDPKLNILYVDKRSPQEQIEHLKEEFVKADERIRLIREITDLKKAD